MIWTEHLVIWWLLGPSDCEVKIFTDGFRTPIINGHDLVGLTVWIPKDDISIIYKLNHLSSSFDVEVWAIFKARHYIGQ